MRTATRLSALFLTATLLLLSGAAGVRAEEKKSGKDLPAKELMRLVDRVNRTDDSSRKLKMLLVNKNGATREREVVSFQKKIDDDNDKALVRFTAPGDIAGTGLLTIEHSDRDDDQWLYLPALKKTRRISAADKNDSFMGTDFTFEDMSSRKIDEYDYAKKGAETVDGVECVVIESVPNNEKRRKEGGYSKSVTWVDPERYVMLKADFYNLKDEFTKTLTLSEFKKQGEIYMPDHMEMITHKTGHKTVLQFSDTQINTGLSDDLFTERTLLRGR